MGIKSIAVSTWSLSHSFIVFNRVFYYGLWFFIKELSQFYSSTILFWWFFWKTSLCIWRFIWGYGYSSVSQAKDWNFYTFTFDILFLNDLIVKNYLNIKYYFWLLKVFQMPNFRILGSKHSVQSLEFGKSHILYPVVFLFCF